MLAFVPLAKAGLVIPMEGVDCGLEGSDLPPSDAASRDRKVPKACLGIGLSVTVASCVFFLIHVTRIRHLPAVLILAGILTALACGFLIGILAYLIAAVVVPPRWITWHFLANVSVSLAAGWYIAIFFAGAG